MPEGIVATVDNGFATLDFVDHALRGPALVKLLEIGGPETIETITRRGSRRQYRVPEGNAREAGLLDNTPLPRGLNVDGTPSENATGGTGTVHTTVDVAAGDSGWATKLVNADPNTGSDITGADGPAAKGPVNWHTPTAEYTSANAAVEKVPNDQILHNRSQVFTGVGTSDGGDLEHPPTHAEVITYVKSHSTGFQRTEGTREPQIPAAVVSNALRAQPGALASDPGGDAPQPNSPVAHVRLNGPQKPSEAPAATKPPLKAPKAAESKPGPKSHPRPRGLPDGEPGEEWKRAELDRYAAWKGVEDPESFANKAEVLDAIAKS